MRHGHWFAFDMFDIRVTQVSININSDFQLHKTYPFVLNIDDSVFGLSKHVDADGAAATMLEDVDDIKRLSKALLDCF